MTYPPGGIGVPVVPFGGDLPERRHDVIPPALILQGATECLCNERAPFARANRAVKLRDKPLVEINVQTRADTLTPTRSYGTASHPGPGRCNRPDWMRFASSGHSTGQLNHFPTSSWCASTAARTPMRTSSASACS